jgi:hypothetical protein
MAENAGVVEINSLRIAGFGGVDVDRSKAGSAGSVFFKRCRVLLLLDG